MIFLTLLIIVTLAISGTAAFFSVYGLATIFPSAFIPSLIMGSSLEAGKLLIVSFLYKSWNNINLFFKSSIIFMTFLLMIFTSMGIFGYLSASYQSSSIEINDLNNKISIVESEESKYQKRLSDINDQIFKIPERNVSGKIRMIRALNSEKESIIKNLESLSNQKIELLSKKIKTEVKVGPMTFLAKAINKPIENSTLYLIFFIMVIFDPLALLLTFAVNVQANSLKTVEAKKESTEISKKSKIINSLKN